MRTARADKMVVDGGVHKMTQSQGAGRIFAAERAGHQRFAVITHGGRRFGCQQAVSQAMRHHAAHHLKRFGAIGNARLSDRGE